MAEEEKATMQKMSNITDDNVIDVYNDIAGSYETSLLNADYKNPEVAVKAFLSKNFPKDIEILDLACGTGIVGEILKKEGYENIAGLDGSELMLKKAEEKTSYKKLIQGMIGNGTHPEDQANKFDAVIATGMFSKGHVKPEGADDIIQALKSGGYAFFSVRDDYVESLGYMAKFKELEEAGKWKF